MEKVKLGDICEVFSGFAFKTFNEDKQGKPVIKIGNIQIDGKISLEECSYTKEIPQEKYFSKVNDIYIALSGATTGKVGIMEQGDFLINQRVGVVRLKNNNIPINYLFSFLKSKTVTILQDAFGAAQPNISPKDILNYEIPLPSLEEQKAIAGKLDKVSGLIEKRKTQLKKLDLLIKSRFIEMFGASNAQDCKKKIADYAKVLGGYAFKSDLFCSNEIPVVRISNICNGSVYLDYNTCYQSSFWRENKKFRVETNDVLMAMSGATTGKAGLYKENLPALINQRVACIRSIPQKSCPEFLFVATQLDWMYDLIQEQSAGCAQPNISGKQIETMPIPEASFEKQLEFAEFVKLIDKSKFEIQKSLEKLEILKKSLMQQYFG